MNAYIQLLTKSWMNRETMTHGLQDRGHIVTLVNNIDECTDKEGIYYGNVGFLRDVVNNLGYKPRPIGHVPIEMYELAGRKIEYVPISQVFREKQSCFIKPTPDKSKTFTGFVYNANQLDSIYVANYFLTGEELVIKSEIVEFVSEWRCYICQGEVLDGKHYTGDFRKTPDYSVADKAVALWKNAPAAWSCDLGVLKDGRTVVVECNDCMCLGMYGLAPHKAGLMLEKRWDEIHFNKSL